MTTRAMRRYTTEPVTDEEIAICLRAAQQGPSGGNVQPQHYLVLTAPNVKSVVGDWYRQAYRRYEATLPAPAVNAGRHLR